MGLAPFLVVLGGGNDRVGRSDRWRRSDWRRGVRIGIDRGERAIGDAAEDRHQAGDDDEERPTVIPGEYVEGVEEEEDADENDPDGAAKSVEDPLLVARGSVIGQAGASVRHLVNEDPDADSNEKEGNEAVHGEAVKHAGISDEEEAAETDEPDGPGGKTVSRDGKVWVVGVRRGVPWCAVGWDWRGRRHEAFVGRIGCAGSAPAGGGRLGCVSCGWRCVGACW